MMVVGRGIQFSSYEVLPNNFPRVMCGINGLSLCQRTSCLIADCTVRRNGSDGSVIRKTTLFFSVSLYGLLSVPVRVNLGAPSVAEKIRVMRSELSGVMLRSASVI